jgi:hypothetical protein
MSEPTLIVVAIIILALLLIGTLAMFWLKRR